MKLIMFIIIILLGNYSYASIGCVGRFVNPITDICWKCLFPITIGGVKVVPSPMADTNNPRQIICFCPKAGIPMPIPGIPIGFWEPVRLVDVTKSPMCMVSLGGINLGTSMQKGVKDDIEGSSFYHVHWYIYPVIYWLEILLDFACLEMSQVDVAYLTEFDLLWGDDAKSAILNPESLLFGNIAAQSACIADCMSSSSGSLSNDGMFWCSGCQGSLYPFTGTTSSYNGGVGTSALIVAKFMAKLHRELLLWGYMGREGLCGKYPMPIIKKCQYRLQMTYPITEIHSCKKIGETETTWQGAREFPVKGEDFGYLIWRKRSCCLF
ncbi:MULTISPECIES: conjugal transfer pilus assembly protein TraU [Rickettsia]|uniref:Conjugal DNA transfer protein TraU n=5 Tax=Rickettsia TaxID=780 RepID=Q1RJF3_RICBR|nr:MULTISPECIES: conjugal transfer pilus assembly protein TraU [Rickettsia]ABE04511.1 Conjugal DNA transfer protein TraU [Rickettsia bellii RML369-C]ALN41277.1 conjugal transfer protein [Rickettsia rhipicephali]ARD86398.1 conjugal transfer protein [Rickettsia bellii]EER21685.1 conjugal DNA transfer protein TraU [Rickettsia endosymbiont of Ixodes scapularis]KDO02640.1 conjugal transfer pilus assembly protein TraU [Rickettsia tamurae subsp. buchneri]